MKIVRNIALLLLSCGFGNAFTADSYQSASDAKNKIHTMFNTTFPVPKKDGFFNSNVFTQPFFFQDKFRDEFKTIGNYIKLLLEKTTLGVSVSQSNKDTINKAWFELSDASNTLLNTISSLRAMNKITADKPITEGKFLVNLNKKQFSDLLETLKTRSKDLPNIKNSLKVAWNDFSQTKEIKEILSLIAMQLIESYRRVIESGNIILAKKG